MNIERLDPNAIQRINGPSWEPLRPAFFELSETLLGACSESVGVLTTIYVKYQVGRQPDSGVFAVVWLKNSRQIVLGLALPDDYESPLLGPPPAGMKYKGITKYLTIRPTDVLPAHIAEWAIAAYNNTQATAKP